MPTVALVGDSHLSDTDFPGTSKLHNRLAAHGWDVAALAVDGLDTRAALELHPGPVPCDWVVFSLGTNDLAPWKEVPAAEYASNYLRVVDRWKGTAAVVLGPPPVREGPEADGRTMQLARLYSSRAAEVAAATGAEWLPLVELLDTDDLAPDGFHMADSGYAKIEARLVTIFMADDGSGRGAEASTAPWQLGSIHHVQLAIPPGGEERCRHFWGQVLGMQELTKPPVLAARGGCWFRSGNLEVHLGVEDPFAPAKKAHPGILVSGLVDLAAALSSSGYHVTWDGNFPGHDRCYVDDPFGNRLELLQPIG